MKKEDSIIIKGARQNNLTISELKIPLYKNIIITGVSGAGKSSLVMDTLYAESQRRFFLSLSTFARQFFERIPPPEVESINELQPSIAVIRKGFIKNPRSTVATITEIYDFLRILFAKKATPFCPSCGREIKNHNPESLKREIINKFSGEKIDFGFITEKPLKEIYGGGFLYALLNGEKDSIFKVKKFPAYIIVDSLKAKKEEEDRIYEAVLTAFHWGERFFVKEGEELYLFSKEFECPYCDIKISSPEPTLFSFNSSKGACPVCRGFGDIIEIDERKIIPNPNLSIEGGAIEPFTKPAAEELKEDLLDFCKKRKIPKNIPFAKLKESDKKLILDGDGDYYGVKGFFDWLETKRYKTHVRVFLSKYRKYTECPECKGSRLNRDALSYKIEGKNIGDIMRMDVEEFYEFLNRVSQKWKDDKAIKIVVEELRERAKYLIKVGLSYLTLKRKTFTLSGGEAQRISLTTVLGTTLSDTMIIIDEPSRGLHMSDFKNLLGILEQLKKNRNTLIMVEHSEDAMKISDEIIELGPKAGKAGGKIVFQGSLKEYKKGETFGKTLKLYSNLKKIRKDIRKDKKFSSFIEVREAKKFNIKGENFKFPVNALTTITGVSGAGKSTLLYEILYKGFSGESFNFENLDKKGIVKAIYIDDSLPSKSSKATVGTYLKLMELIRDFFAGLPESKSRGFKKAHFSFNRKEGQCPECKGNGLITVELQFLSDINLVCDSCKGKRFKEDVLKVKYKGLNIYDIMALTLSELEDFFRIEIPEFEKRIRIIKSLGIDYLKLGQTLSTLSGGESQRIKLAKYFGGEKVKNVLFLIDEPTVGLHPLDIEKLLNTFKEYLKKGATIITVEHNPLFIFSSDYIVDMGPGGGRRGGKLVFEGTMDELLKSDTITAMILKEKILSVEE